MIIYGGYSWCEKKTAHDENPSNNLRCGVEEGVEYKTDVNLCLNQIQKQYTNIDTNTNTFLVVR